MQAGDLDKNNAGGYDKTTRTLSDLEEERKIAKDEPMVVGLQQYMMANLLTTERTRDYRHGETERGFFTALATWPRRDTGLL